MSLQEKNESSIIKVIDKRRFSSDGTVRDDTREDPKKPVVLPAAAEASKRAAENPRGGEAPASGVDFINFIASLATSALASLGLLPEARARGIPTNLQAAREYIDVIGMLQEKTKGNLSSEEETSLTRLIGELRAQYVQVTQAQAQAQAQAAAQQIPGAQGLPPGMPRPPGMR
jgi:hypothetical protein